ncbi:MAG: tagatose 1,6-diphosphate aldolase [Pleurocapsa minor GSE-CHR-MK-17-07R]|jgi:tagatose-1,6-bisphosphate aldolase|nr:tagatose 1,6-diphosphate aldolase [Pleurocapsa minor GSE-CHR-MK 17-07R]
MTSPGKLRALDACATPAGHFNVLAVDHRGNLWEALEKYGPVDDAAFLAFKRDTISRLAPYASAVLTDPTYGIGMGIAEGWLPAHLGLLAPLEVTNYSLKMSDRAYTPVPHWSVGKIRRVGGQGVKLLLYYHPQAENAATQRAIAADVVASCAAHDLPLFLEPIVFSTDPATPLTASGFRDAVVGAAADFSALGIDILKSQFPCDPALTSDEREWKSALRDLDAACTVPWALLSAGVSYDVFRRQAQMACDAGCSGVIVGRAVWNEAVTAPSPAARRDMLGAICAPRVQELGEICAAGRPFREKLSVNTAFNVDWTQAYGEL